MTLLRETLGETLGELDSTILTILGLLGTAGWIFWWHWSSYIDVPSIGVPSGPLGSWRAAFGFIQNADRLVKEGYNKYSKDGGLFKISCPTGWFVFVTDEASIAELKDAPEDVLSFDTAISNRISMPYTLDNGINDQPYHLPLIQRNLTQHFSMVLPDVIEEVALSWKDGTSIGPEWSKINVWNVMLSVISRTTNRMFVGLPLCRNQEYLDVVVNYATKIGLCGAIIELVPRPLKLIVAWQIVGRNKTLKQVIHHVGPIFEERKKKMQMLGEKWTDRPNDAIQWILDSVPPGKESTIRQMSMRLLFFNFAAIHTSCIGITQVLFDLAANPQLLVPLKEEIEGVLKESGWTKPGLTKMKKLDSLLRESQRLNGIGAASMVRQALKPYTFKNGNYVPKGAYLCSPSAAIHTSSENYKNPTEFDGFRFARTREEEGNATKFQMASPAPDYLAFGLGKHACPGRFFAANELKVILAQLILNYEIKTLDGKRPANKPFGMNYVPAVETELLFRTRPDVTEWVEY